MYSFKKLMQHFVFAKKFQKIKKKKNLSINFAELLGTYERISEGFPWKIPLKISEETLEPIRRDIFW